MGLLFGRGQAGWQVSTISSKAALLWRLSQVDNSLLECVDLGKGQSQHFPPELCQCFHVCLDAR